MVILGETILQGRLSAPASLAYWLICMCLTALAMMVALLDLRALRERSREQQRDLFEQTLKNIESEAEVRRRNQQKN